MVTAERMAGVRGEAVIASLAGPHINSQNSRGGVAVSRQDREIDDEDVERVVEASRAISVASDRQVNHVLPRPFPVDGQEAVQEATGLTGHHLEVETNHVAGQ